MIKDKVVMLREFFAEFTTTGTICPSGKWAASALANPLAQPRTHKRILEIGAGTGPVTVVILKQMTEQDELTICELNPNLMKELRRRLDKNEDFLRHRSRVTFFEGPVQDLPEDKQYDVHVCALPFLNFEVSLVEEIFSKLLRISTEDAVMTYFEYIGLRKLSKVMPKRKQRIEEVESYFQMQYFPRLIDLKKVWLNILPINVYTLDMAAPVPA